MLYTVADLRPRKLSLTVLGIVTLVAAGAFMLWKSNVEQSVNRAEATSTKTVVAKDRLPDGRAPTVITYEPRTGAVSVRAGAPAGELDRVLATLRQGPPSPGVRGRGAEGDGQAIDRGT